MIIFLYGPDTYRSRQKLNEIVEHYQKIHKSGLNLRYLDGETTNYQEFKDEIKTIPIFNERKLIVLTNTLSNNVFKEKFLKDAKKIMNSRNTILFYERNPVSQNDSLFKFLKKWAKSQEFELLGGLRLKKWAEKELKNYSLKIEASALLVLINYIGNNLWQFSQEIKKIANFKAKSKNIKVSQKDIGLLIKPKIDSDIFKTVDAICDKNKKLALDLLYKHLEKGDSPLYLLSMINFQFRNLLVVKSRESECELYTNNMRILSKELKMHPYVARKTLWQARKFTFEEIKKIYQKIFKTDLNIKTGRIEPETALDLLIAEI